MTKETDAKKPVVELKKVTRPLLDANEIKHYMSDGTIKKTYHQDVAKNIYRKDGSVVCLFAGKEIESENRLALCKRIALIITKGKAVIIVNGTPDLQDGSPRHSVAWLNYHGVTALNGNKVQNK